jgi:5-formyltetrahydrofolate cyclo-ligase
LEHLRYRALEDGKAVLVTTYAIRRGFWLLDPSTITTPETRRLASFLDTMEKPGLGKHITLAEMKQMHLCVDLMVTGTGAINGVGIRFGKGHGFFDLEWAMLTSIGVVDLSVPCVAVVHDCQVLDDELKPEIFDTVCDHIVTPTKVIEVQGLVHKPTCGILWDRLQPGMLVDIPPLLELQHWQRNN